MSPNDSPVACPLAQCDVLQGSLDDLLKREFLLTNGLGSYCSSSVLCCHTRKYHGLYVRATQPPVGRTVLLNNMLARCWVDKQCSELSTFAFERVINPQGYTQLVSVWQHADEASESFCMLYGGKSFELRLVMTMFRGLDIVRFDLRMRPQLQYQTSDLAIDLLPFCSLRDIHGLRRKPALSPLGVEQREGALLVSDTFDPNVRLCLASPEASYVDQPDWWFAFHYREEPARGHEGIEDQFVPGYFRVEGRGELAMTLFAGVEPSMPMGQTQAPDVGGIGPSKAPPINLDQAGRQFICQRSGADARGPTLVAGYPWFGDWGRDSFISLPGLLLESGRIETAKGVLNTFAGTQQNGLIPNVFDDYSNEPRYNSVDAALWYTLAAEKTAAADGDDAIFDGPVGRAVVELVKCFSAGTDYGIVADADGLLHAGDTQTQLTWMDAKVGGTVFTPGMAGPLRSMRCGT